MNETYPNREKGSEQFNDFLILAYLRSSTARYISG